MREGTAKINEPMGNIKRSVARRFVDFLRGAIAAESRSGSYFPMATITPAVDFGMFRR